MKDSEANLSEVMPFSLERVLADIAHLLPTQGPIKDFIHHNTLHAYQSQRFYDAVNVAAQINGTKEFAPAAWYLEQYRQGRIAETALARVAASRGITTQELPRWKEELLQRSRDPKPFPGLARSGLRENRFQRTKIDLDRLVHPFMFKLLSSYLDQGIAIWRFPHATTSLWEALGRLIEESLLPIPPFQSDECRSLFKMTPQSAIEYCLKRLAGREEYYEPYLLEMCLAHPGWSGMIAVLSSGGQSLLAPRPIRLEDVVAIELICELGFLRKRLGEFPPESEYYTGPVHRIHHLRPKHDEAAKYLRIWQEALEWTFYEGLLTKVQKREPLPETGTSRPSVQAFFCIDDRMCSLRRHLETIAPTVETFGTAGFFGIDFMFQPASSAHAFQYCPVVLKPKHVVREIATGEKPVSVPKLKHLLHLSPTSNTLFRGWMLTQTLGIVAALRLAISIFFPGFRLLSDRKLSQVSAPTELQLLREGDAKTDDGQYIGYSFDEMADRVANVLRSSGIVMGFSDLLVFVAHGASSANNPHFAAYDCGACSGKPGSPNARAFAWMANHPEVRHRLPARGITLGEKTFIVGGIHDTTADEVTFFDTEKIPSTHRENFESFKQSIELALGRNAVERCARFELAPANPCERAARKHVRDRSMSIFEPRPELNHAGNIFAVVGRRKLTRGLFLDRRAFLNSYDPIQDPQGKILEGILGAVVPVCGGINLEYYFSRIDNEKFGAGTKLPHNVVSLIGVSNGVEGDLLTGLPWQMVEIHDPVRLLILIEQEPQIVLDTITRNAGIFEWIKNGWVYLACFSPSQKRNFLFVEGKMEEIVL